MTREEAINLLMSANVWTDEERTAWETLIPELAESEDERIRKFLVDFFASYKIGDAETKLNGVRIDDILAYLEKQKEHKPAESISQQTVQGKSVYKICPRCKERMVRDDSMVYTSMPPQYRYECPKCGESECDTVMYDNPEMEEQKPTDLSKMMVHSEPYIAPIPTPMVADEQKPEWSEEDETRLTNTLIMLKEYAIHHYSKDDVEKSVDWLENRVKFLRSQPKQEWSDEEYGRLFDIEHYLDGTLQLSPDRRIACIDFLKSLRSQSHWKPSKEQMEVLKDYADSAIDSQRDIEGNILFSLYDDLKKLM